MRTALFLMVVLPAAMFADIAVSLPANSFRDSSAGGVSSFGRWSNSNGGFQINWNITQTGSTYSYIYTLTNDSGGNLNQGVKSFVLELNPDITPSNLSTVITGSSLTIVAGATTFTPGSSGLTNLPGNIYGIQFDGGGASTLTLSFTSTNAPVWGSFYADNGKTGSGSRGYAYNNAFSSNPTTGTTNFTNWVPTVGGGVLAPEPSTMLILGSTLVAAAYIHKRRKAQQT